MNSVLIIYKPTLRIENSRHSNFAGTISSCKCCIESSSGLKLLLFLRQTKGNKYEKYYH